LPVVFLKFAFKPMVSMIFYLKCLLEFLVVHSNPTPKKKQAVCFYFSRFGGIPPDSASIMLLAAISDIFDLVSKVAEAI